MQRFGESSVGGCCDMALAQGPWLKFLFGSNFWRCAIQCRFFHEIDWLDGIWSFTESLNLTQKVRLLGSSLEIQTGIRVCAILALNDVRV